MSEQQEHDNATLSLTRRHLLIGSAALCALAVANPALAIASREVKALKFYNLHTAEKEEIAFFHNGKFDAEALKKINHLLRDHRTGEVYPIDPKLITHVHAVHKKLGSSSPIEIISGYRSAKSNTMLRQRGGGGVARKSKHLQGMAIDFNLQDVALDRVYNAAKDMQCGGVGMYESSGFVHLDTGRVRSW